MSDHVALFGPSDTDVESQEVSVTEGVDDGGETAVAGGAAAALHAQAPGRQIEVVTYNHCRVRIEPGSPEQAGQNVSGAIHVCKRLCEHQPIILRGRSRAPKAVPGEQGLSQRNIEPRGGLLDYREPDVMPRPLESGPGVPQAHNEYGQPLLLGFLGLSGFRAFLETFFAFDFFLFDLFLDFLTGHRHERDGLILTVEDLDTFEVR